MNNQFYKNESKKKMENELLKTKKEMENDLVEVLNLITKVKILLLDLLPLDSDLVDFESIEALLNDIYSNSKIINQLIELEVG